METVLAYIEDILIPRLTNDRVRTILAHAREIQDGTEAQIRALRAARDAGREEEVVGASERLRAAVWDHAFDSTHADAWIVSWLLARAATGVATVDLVGDGHYNVSDYIDLISPLVAGFPDFPLPVREEH